MYSHSAFAAVLLDKSRKYNKNIDPKQGRCFYLYKSKPPCLHIRKDTK